jgi:hypothetical protein
MGGYWEQCIPNDRLGYDTREVLSSGVSKMGACLFSPNLDRKFHPKAGDLYLFAEHLSFWEHLIHCGKWGCK